MATGIVSIAAALLDFRLVAMILLAVNLIAFPQICETTNEGRAC
jgi:hypothetical protein